MPEVIFLRASVCVFVCLGSCLCVAELMSLCASNCVLVWLSSCLCADIVCLLQTLTLGGSTSVQVESLLVTNVSQELSVRNISDNEYFTPETVMVLGYSYTVTRFSEEQHFPMS